VVVLRMAAGMVVMPVVMIRMAMRLVRVAAIGLLLGK